MARDDFLKTVIEKLKNRVGSRCSNPNCRVSTTAASDESDDKVNSIGVAAHICAASAGGPRYSPEMNREQRRSIKNGIWLCSPCSIKIDRDVATYTVASLREWKKNAEILGKKELGKKLPSENDSIDTVTAALTGLPKKFLSTAISNVHKATAQSLENLDPRFCVKTSHDEKGTCFSIFAKEDVNFVMNIESEHSFEYVNKYNGLVDHGDDFEMDVKSLNFDGSKLLSELSDVFGSGKVVIASNKISAIQKLWLVNKDTSVVDVFEDIKGNVTFGEKSLGFVGSSCNGIFDFNYRKLMVSNVANINLKLTFDKWDNKNINYLPFFSKIYSLFNKLSDGWELYTALEVDGIKVIESHGLDGRKIKAVNELLIILSYINNVSKISKFLDKKLIFKHDFSYTIDEYNYIGNIVDIIEGKCIYKSLKNNPSCVIVANEEAENIDYILNKIEPTTLEIREVNDVPVVCFGVELQLPKKKTIFNNVIPKISLQEREFKEGDKVSVEFIQCDGFECRVMYIQDT
ncbi:MAG: hypothetical protein QM500_17295 [Methylococcales bacterium]